MKSFVVGAFAGGVNFTIWIIANTASAADRPKFIEVIDMFSEEGVRRVEPNWDVIDKNALGTEGNPIRCEMPDGERAYLNRLLCADGNHATYSRIGGVSESPYGQIMDAYDVNCEISDQTLHYTVYMDMYHSGYDEVRPVPGFGIRPIAQY